MHGEAAEEDEACAVEERGADGGEERGDGRGKAESGFAYCG